MDKWLNKVQTYSPIKAHEPNEPVVLRRVLSSPLRNHVNTDFSEEINDIFLQQNEAEENCAVRLYEPFISSFIVNAFFDAITFALILIVLYPAFQTAWLILEAHILLFTIETCVSYYQKKSDYENHKTHDCNKYLGLN